MNPTDPANPRTHLARSYSAPMRLHDGTPPSQLVDALDVGTEPKRTRSNQRLTPATPQLMSPSPPSPNSRPANVIRVRSMTDDVAQVTSKLNAPGADGAPPKGDQARKSKMDALHVLVEEHTEARWLLRRVCFQRDENGKVHTVPAAVGQGAHGEVYMARYEPKDGPPSLWVLKETKVRQKPTDKLPRVRSEAHVAHEIRAQHAAGSEFYAQKCLQWGNKLLLASPPGHGALVDLKAWLQRLPPDEADTFVMDMVVQLLRHLTYMTDAPTEDELIVHCDIKPENILYRKDFRRFYLIDFSSAEFGEASDVEPSGTPGFIAPERLAGSRTPKADMWSLGCAMMDLLTGSFLEPMNVTYPPQEASIDALALPFLFPALAPRATSRSRTSDSDDGYDAFMESLFGKANGTGNWDSIPPPLVVSAADPTAAAEPTVAATAPIAAFAARTAPIAAPESAPAAPPVAAAASAAPAALASAAPTAPMAAPESAAPTAPMAAPAPQARTAEARSWYFMVFPLLRYAHWLSLRKAWERDPHAPPIFSSEHYSPHRHYPDIDQTDAYLERFYPRSHAVMRRLLEWDPNDRPTAEVLLDELDSTASRYHQRALARLWARVPISDRMKRAIELYTEPTLPPLRRTTSADNVAAMACDAKPARKTSV